MKSKSEAAVVEMDTQKEREGKKMDVHFCLTTEAASEEEEAKLSEEEEAESSKAEEASQRWYKIDPNAPSDDEQLRPQSIAKGIPFLSPNPVVLGTKIYLIGGSEDTKCPPNSVAYHVSIVPTCSVVVYDTKREMWEVGTPMIGGKFRPLAAVRAGQIYVFSSSMSHILRDEVWAELYDPTSDSWSDLPHPPSQLQRRHGYDFCYILNEYTQDQEILFKCREKSGIWGFDFKTHQWNQHPEFNNLDNLLPVRTRPPRVALKNFFYFWECRRLFAYNLATAKEIPITNSEFLENSVNPHPHSIFLLHSGSDQLSLLWSEGDLPDKCRVCCLTFLTQMTTEGGLLLLPNPQHASYIAKGECFRYCLPVTPTASSLSGYKRKSFASSRHATAYSDKEHSEFQLEGSKECAWRTRHARRVYVDNIPSRVNGKILLSFFHSALEKIGTDSVCRKGAHLDGAYVNDALGFAILEFPTIEHASNAMALDGIIFKGAPLRIRRPIDYNPGLAASLGPTQPNWVSNLMDIPRKPCGKTDDVVNMLRRTMQALAWETSNLNKSENGLQTSPSCVICLLEGVCSANAILDPELKSEKKFYTLIGKQYGELEKVVIPLKQNDPAFGRVFLQYKNLAQSAQAMEGFCRSLRPFLPFYYPQNKFEEGDYSYLDDYCDICLDRKLQALEWDQRECKLHIPSKSA